MSLMKRFEEEVSKKYKMDFKNYEDFHEWSIKFPEIFWGELFEFFSIKYSGSLNPAYEDLSFEKYTWFPSVKLNFAENLLRHRDYDQCALNFLHESGFSIQLSYHDVYQQTAGLISMICNEIKKGDVLAAYMPNIPQTVVSMLATSSLGGVFTSTSCDFGVDGVVDSFLQSEPKVLFACVSYEYNGKFFDQTQKILEIQKKLPSVQKVILVDFLNSGVDLSLFKNAIEYNDLFDFEASEIHFEETSFQDPLYIMYSSGTTGKPKCIVHSVGGTLLQHVKELGLHCNLQEKEKIFFFTTCGWMMWNWLVSSLFFKSEVVLYEGSPAFPSLESFVQIIDRERLQIFGTGPKFLKILQDAHLSFNSSFPSLRMLLSTGAPLLEEQFEYIWTSLKKDLHISSICGGTDILGCFMLGHPDLTVRSGEIQVKGLGMDVAVFNEKGEEVIGELGELVCKKSFPSRPLYFLNDPSSEKIKKSYFQKFPSVWHHGDFIEENSYGGIKVFGRSDATLNPGGVRIGTAEIYRQCEKLDFVEDSLCIGRKNGGDVDIILFIKPKQGMKITEEKELILKKSISKNCTPRHVPRFIYSISEIPYTRSGKKMEMAVSKLINNLGIPETEGCVNPDSLKLYDIYKINS